MLFIICGNGFAYAQTFNETPIPAFTLHKEMKTPQIFKLPEKRILCQKPTLLSITVCR